MHHRQHYADHERHAGQAAKEPDAQGHAPTISSGVEVELSLIGALCHRNIPGDSSANAGRNGWGCMDLYFHLPG